MAIDYSKLRWDDLVRQAQSDHQNQWNTKDSFDPFSGGMTNIGGNQAQILLQGSDEFSPSGYNMWDSAGFNFKDQNGPEGYMTRLAKGKDGGVDVGYYKEENGIPLGLLAVLAAPFAATMMGAGAGAGVEAGAGMAGEMSLADAFATYAPEFGSEVAAAGMADAPFAYGLSDLAATGLPEAGLDVGNLGLDQYLSDYSIENLGVGADGALESTIAADGANQYASEAAKLLRQNAAEAGSLIGTDIPTIALSSGLPTSLMLKAASALLRPSAGGESGGYSSGVVGGTSGYGANVNPGMVKTASAPEHGQASINPVFIQDAKQPVFNPGGYLEIPDGVEKKQDENAKLMQLAKALKEAQWQA